jgi:hypothetical protein
VVAVAGKRATDVAAPDAAQVVGDGLRGVLLSVLVPGVLTQARGDASEMAVVAIPLVGEKAAGRPSALEST